MTMRACDCRAEHHAVSVPPRRTPHSASSQVEGIVGAARREVAPEERGCGRVRHRRSPPGAAPRERGGGGLGSGRAAGRRRSHTSRLKPSPRDGRPRLRWKICDAIAKRVAARSASTRTSASGASSMSLFRRYVASCRRLRESRLHRLRESPGGLAGDPLDRGKLRGQFLIARAGAPLATTTTCVGSIHAGRGRCAVQRAPPRASAARRAPG
jgi:hypothetical protein